jgi:hypothetical protein
MRTITIRQLDQNLFKELEDLPVLVTRYGKPYCQIIVANPEAGIKAYAKSTGSIGGVAGKTSKLGVTPPQGKLISKVKSRIPLSKEMEEKILHPEEKPGLAKQRGELNAEDYI